MSSMKATTGVQVQGQAQVAVRRGGPREQDPKGRTSEPEGEAAGRGCGEGDTQPHAVGHVRGGTQGSAGL